MLQPNRALAQFRSALSEAIATSYPNPFPSESAVLTPSLVSSGRAALTLILLALKQQSSRSRVVVPAYSCPTVVQSVLAAGLEPVFCDVSPDTLDLDRAALTRLASSDLLAVLATHLYGLAQDVAGLVGLGRENGFYIVEDAAQALGARVGGRMVGTRGDAGFYSLGRGKCLPVGSGGVIVAQPQHRPALSDAVRQSNLRRPTSTLQHLAMFLGYSLATRPRPWALVVRTRLNPAAEGMDVSALPPMRLAGLSAAQAGIGRSILARLDQVQATWKRNARRLMDMLAPFDFVTLPEILPEADPVFLRLPLVADTAERADRLFALLWKEGIGVSRSYYRTLPDLWAGYASSGRTMHRGAPPGSEYPGACRLAACLLTLPTNSYLADADLVRIVGAFDRCT